VEGDVLRRRVRPLVLVAIVGLLAIGGVSPAAARPAQVPTVGLGSAASLAPDGLSLTIDVIASCPERSTVVEARVTVSQPQAFGSGSFPLTCIGSKRPFFVTVRSTGGRFELGPAQAVATVVVQRGRSAQVQDSATVQLDPTVIVDLADTAVLQDGSGALTIGVTVACPPGPTGQESYVAVSQGNIVGRGFYVPTCDGEPHTFFVDVTTSEGVFQPGAARGLSFADVVFGGMAFSGVADEPVQIAT
jgi:hypothetical protein